MKAPREQRQSNRYTVQMPVHYRVSRRGVAGRWVESISLDMSSNGLCFRSRHAIPVGSHIELWLEWPARHDDQPMELHATGLIVRSNTYKTAIRITSRRFTVSDVEAPAIRATA